MSTLLVFFLGFHVNDIKTRFMATKSALLAVGSCIDSLNTLTVALFRGDEHRERREKLRRHCLNLYKILWVSSNHLAPGDSSSNLELESEETSQLAASPKPSITLVLWMQELFEPLRAEPDLFVVALGHLRELENKFNAVLRSAYNQLPFPYVHLIGTAPPRTLTKAG